MSTQSVPEDPKIMSRSNNCTQQGRRRWKPQSGFAVCPYMKNTNGCIWKFRAGSER